MGYQALLFCPDDKLARVVTQVLSDLDFSVETATEPFAAVKKLMAQHFDAVVVDCDNEQNATLLFKSARNSSSNQSSLAVAVVEGQAGVAKAFRIGANLVLTKPINVEQAKGTLRVARGLLRKGVDAKAPAAATRPTAPAPPAVPRAAFDPPKPVAPPVRKPVAPAFAEPKPPAPPLVAASAGPIEVEIDPTPSLDAADAAMLESMPAPEPSTRPSTEFAWQPAKSQAGTMASALQRAAAEAAVKSAAPQPKVAPPAPPEKKPARANTAAAAAAPALARELFEAPVAETAAIAPAVSTRHDEPQPEVPAPSFAAFGEDEIDESSKSKKPYFIVAAIIIAAGTAYYGWTLKQEPSSTKPATTTSPASVAPAETTPAQPAPTSAVPAEPVRPAPQSQTQGEDEPAATHASRAGVPSNSKTGLIAEDTVTKASPIVVKSDLSRAQRPAAPASEPAPQAPSLSPSAGSGDATISSLVASTPVNVPKHTPQTLRVSQGVSQGLILKRVQPVYPQPAMQMRLQGAVQLLATINKEGQIANVTVLSGDSVLARAASDAVRQWKYKPYYLNGEPVEIQTQITVNFKLPN